MTLQSKAQLGLRPCALSTWSRPLRSVSVPVFRAEAFGARFGHFAGAFAPQNPFRACVTKYNLCTDLYVMSVCFIINCML